MENSLEALTENVRQKGHDLGMALAHERRLDDQRGLVKALAIIRIMESDKIAATPAEKIVEKDSGYMEHRERQHTAVIDRMTADAEYQAAKAALTQASLITPSMIELETQIARLEERNDGLGVERDSLVVRLKVSTRQTDQKEIDLRKARRYLSDRIDDVDRLEKAVYSITEENRNLRAGMMVAPTEIPKSKEYVDSLEQSRDLLVGEGA